MIFKCLIKLIRFNTRIDYVFVGRSFSSSKGSWPKKGGQRRGEVTVEVDALEHFDAIWLILPATVIAICIFEIWYSLRARKKGWLS